MMTRVDPKTDIEIIDGCWSTPLDPRMSPQKKEAQDYTDSRAVYYAVRPFGWREQFPKVSRPTRELFESVVKKYKGVVPFPGL
jgi:4-hydroxy-3-polyprenylbenzoate decarboxylase